MIKKDFSVALFTYEKIYHFYLGLKFILTIYTRLDFNIAYILGFSKKKLNV
jgi:hypothetical protein